MSDATPASDRYATGDYLSTNPTWHVEDSAWKAGHIAGILQRNAVTFSSAVEVGSGAGAILSSLQERFAPEIRWVGWEVAPQAHALAVPRARPGLSFRQGDFLAESTENFDLLLLIDVIEHVENPHQFARDLRNRARWKVFHIPLDLSALNIARSWPLLTAKRDVGHLSYYTADLAQALLRDAGYTIVDTAYTSIQLDGVGKQVQLRGKMLRKLLFRWKPDLAVRLLGGWSLLVLAT